MASSQWHQTAAVVNIFFRATFRGKIYANFTHEALQKSAKTLIKFQPLITCYITLYVTKQVCIKHFGSYQHMIIVLRKHATVLF